MRPVHHLLSVTLCAASALLPACGESTSPTSTVAKAPAPEQGAAEQALVRAQEVIRVSQALRDQLAHERRSRDLVVTGAGPLDPATPLPPDGLALEGRVLSFDEPPGVVFLSLGAETGVRQGYRLTISRGNRYVGIVEVDGVDAERSRGRLLQDLQKLTPQAGDRVSLR